MNDGRTQHREQEPAGGERQMVASLLGDFWAQALLTAGAAEDEARRLVDRLATVVKLGPDDVQRYRGELSRRLATHRKQLEQSIDGAVQDALQRLRLPSTADFTTLRQRISDLSARLDRLETRTPPSRPPTQRGGKV